MGFEVLGWNCGNERMKYCSLVWDGIEVGVIKQLGARREGSERAAGIVIVSRRIGSGWLGWLARLSWVRLG